MADKSKSFQVLGQTVGQTKPQTMSQTVPQILALDSFEASLGYSFKDKTLLLTALTHSSFANEKHSDAHNERLEFLGDAVLEVNISLRIFTLFPEEREGYLTRMRSRMVSEAKLAELANSLELGKYLRLGRGEDAQEGRTRPALLADAMEAVLGAVFLDGGPTRASELIDRLYQGQCHDPVSLHKGQDYKTMLQEKTQAEFKALPSYVPLTSSGPEHAKRFSVKLTLPDGQTFVGNAGSVKRAEQDAARKAIDHCYADR